MSCLKKTRGKPSKYPTMTHDALRVSVLSGVSEQLRKEAGLKPDAPLGLTTNSY